MGLFSHFTKTAGNTGKMDYSTENTKEAIVLSPTSHTAQDEIYGDETDSGDYIVYRVSFQVNDSFREANSHAGEVEMLHTYAPGSEYGEEGSCPYLAIQIDDPVYMAVEEFKEKGTVTGALELTPLSGKFYFKAKIDYYEDVMYFYGLDRCDGAWENSGLCMVYPKAYVGTEDEAKLMQILDAAAASYREEQDS